MFSMIKITMRSNFFPLAKVGDGATGLADTYGLNEQGTLDEAGVAGKIGFNVGLFVALFDFWLTCWLRITRFSCRLWHRLI